MRNPNSGITNLDSAFSFSEFELELGALPQVLMRTWGSAPSSNSNSEKENAESKFVIPEFGFRIPRI